MLFICSRNKIDLQCEREKERKENGREISVDMNNVKKDRQRASFYNEQLLSGKSPKHGKAVLSISIF